MSIFSEIEKTIERGFRHWTEKAFGPAQSDELLLVHRAILEEIESRVQTVARGNRIFPYTRLAVTLSSPKASHRVLYEAAFGERLAQDIRDVLRGAGCAVPRGFDVDVQTSETGQAPFQIDYTSDPSVERPAHVTFLRGKAQVDSYVLEKARTNIGRLPELTDFEHRVVRRNDIVFEEGADEANGTVSRAHAHILREQGEYRICDDGSEFGTRVFRDGRSVEVPAGNRRGERLRPGDEIYLGRACMRFEQ